VELLLACEELYSKKIDFEQLAIDKATTLRDLDRQIRAL
jgi:acyl carrier protein